MNPDDARNKFLKQILADLEVGPPEPLEAYQALFPGHNHAIAQEYERVLSERQEAETRVSGPAATEEGADGFSALLTQLSEHSPPASRYELKGEFARGGMGAILKVWDKDLRRNLAMKIVLGKQDPASKGSTPTVDERTLGRFLEEAQVTGQLDHPGVVPVHELGLGADGQVYFTMRLVKGRTLSEIFEFVREGKEGWTQTRALNVLLKACETMAYAHSKGVIHRDLKPSNVMVGKYGEVYVMDWGLAKVMGQEDTHDLRLKLPTTTAVRTERSKPTTPDSPLITMDGTVVGTPSYMSPEQARGDIDELGAHSDVYAMGAILYELLAGHAPYVRPGVKLSPRTILASLIDGPPRPVHEMNASVPAELDAICEKAMARRAVERYVDTEALAQDLRAFLEHRVVSAYETGALAKLRKWVARNKPLAAASAAAVVAMVGGLTTSSSLYVKAKEKAEEASVNAARALANAAQAQTNEERMREERDRADENAIDAERRSYTAFLFAAETAKNSGNNAEAQRLHELCPQRYRQWEWYHQSLELDPALQVLEGHGGGVNTVAYSPDGRYIVSGAMGDKRGERTLRPATPTSGANSSLRVWDAKTWEPLPVLEGYTDRVLTVTFSPDGRRIVAGLGDTTLHILDVATWKVLQILRSPLRAAAAVAFSSNGRRVVAGFGDRTLRIWDAETGKPLRVLRGHTGEVKAVAFSPHGRRIVSGADDATLRIWDAETGELLRVLEGHTRAVRTVVLSRDGQRIISGAEDGTLRIWDADTGESLYVLEGHTAEVNGVALAPDERYIASASEDRALRIWDAETGEPLRILEGHTQGLRTVVFSPDGQYVVTGSQDRTVRVWDPETESSVVVKGYPEGGRADIAFGPKGLSLAAWSDDKHMRIWDAETGELLRTLKGLTEEVHAVAFSSDGRFVVSAEQRRSTPQLRVWNVNDGEPLQKQDVEENLSAIDFFPVLRVIGTVPSHASSVQTLLRRLSVVTKVALAGEDPADVRLVRGNSGPLAFSPDGSRIVSTVEDTNLRIDDVETGEQLRVLRGHTEEVKAVAFSPDGQRIVSGADDGTLRIWDAETGDALRVLEGHTEGVQTVVFSPDGQRIASRSTDGNVRIWESRVEQALPVWRAQAELRPIEAMLDHMFEEYAVVEDVLDALAEQPDLSEALRQRTQERARLRVDLTSLKGEAWSIVDPDGKGKGDPVIALRLASVAVGRAPQAAAYRDTLAWALFANGLYDEALAESSKALELASKRRVEEYQGYLDRLRSMIEQRRSEADAGVESEH